MPNGRKWRCWTKRNVVQVDLNVPVLGIALLGVIIVALMLVNDQNKPNNTAVVDGGADDDF